MPLYAIATEGNPQGVERVLLSFPKGVDLRRALEYVSQNYQCQARPIPLMETGEVVEIVKQSKPKIVRAAAAQAEEQDEETAESDGDPIDVESDDMEIADGTHDPRS